MKTTLLSFLLLICFFQLSAQTHTITIHPNNRVASLLMPTSEYQDYVTNDGFADNATRQALVADIYQKFNDEFDFVFLVLNETAIPTNLTYYGQLIKVSNDISGIGMNAYNYAQDYGSDGKLQAVIGLTALTYVKLGPTLHEIMHNWGNFAFTTGAYFGQPVTNYIPHWGFTGGNTPGQLGGFKQSTLLAKGNNTYEVESFGPFANGGNGLPYNQLELYLMGLIPVLEVDSFDVFNDISASADASGKNTFTAATRTTWYPSKITADIGTRNPSSSSSQKKFRALFVVLTPTPLTEQEWTTIDDHVNWFGKAENDGTSLYNFWEATGGRATIETGNLQTTVGLPKLSDNNYFSILPNPANDFVSITSGQSAINEVFIYNSIGQVVLRNTFGSQQQKCMLSTAQLENGMYTIQTKLNGGNTIIQKVFVFHPQ